MGTADEVRERFEWDARSFDSIYRRSNSRPAYWLNRVFRKAIFERFRITFERAGDLKGKAVLDIGCGSGIYCAEFVRRGAGRVVGLDFSQPMLDLARAEVQKHNATDQCTFIKSDFMTVELSERFDVAIAMGVFDYLSAPKPFLKKMRDVTSGVVLASFPAPSGARGYARRMRYRMTGRGDVYFYSRNDVAQLAREAGFSDFELVDIDARFSGSGFVLVGKT